MADIHNVNGKDIEVDVPDDEELQDLLHGKLVILQKKEGYRFSVDPILLTSFVDYHEGEKIMDLGTGSGIIPLLLAHMKPENKAEIVGLEIQEEMADMAERSVAANRMEDEISIQQGNICTVRKDFKADSFDVVISNPPYIAKGKGNVNPSETKALARHEVNVTLTDVVEAARYLTKPKGKVYFIYPVMRLTDLICECRTKNLEPRRLRFVHANQLSGAKLVMVEAIRDAGTEMKVIKPMVVYNNDGTYTEEVAEILNEIVPV